MLPQGFQLPAPSTTPTIRVDSRTLKRVVGAEDHRIDSKLAGRFDGQTAITRSPPATAPAKVQIPYTAVEALAHSVGAAREKPTAEEEQPDSSPACCRGC